MNASTPPTPGEAVTATGTPTFARALITGASGFVGQALARHLALCGVDVTCSGRHLPEHPAPGTWHLGDLGDWTFVRGLVEQARPDVVFNLAGRVTGSRDLAEVEPTLRVNLAGAIGVLSAVTELSVGRVVLIGSTEEPRSGDTPCSPYAAAKSAQLGYARLFHELYATPVTVARLAMIYGPDQPDRTKVVPYSIISFLTNTPPKLSAGTRRADWVMVDDVVAGLIAVAEAPNTLGQVVDVGTGRGHSVREVVEMIADVLGTVVVPEWGALPERAGEVDNLADVTTARQLANWTSTIDLRTGLAKTVEWYASELGRQGRSVDG